MTFYFKTASSKDFSFISHSKPSLRIPGVPKYLLGHCFTVITQSEECYLLNYCKCWEYLYLPGVSQLQTQVIGTNYEMPVPLVEPE